MSDSEGYDDADFEDYDDDGFESDHDISDLEAPAAHIPRNESAFDAAPGPSLQFASANQQQQQQPRPSTSSRPGTSSSAKRQLGLGNVTLSPSGAVLTDAQRKLMAQKLLKSQEKMKLVTLQATAEDVMYSSPPMSLYKLYSLGLGPYASLMVRGCQTNDDAKEQDAQTDEVAARHVPCQVPDDTNREAAELAAASVQCTMFSPAAAPSPAPAAARPVPAPAKKPSAPKPAAAGNMTKFLQWAAPLMLRLLEANARTPTITIKATAADNTGGISRGHVQLQHAELLRGRQPAAAAFCPSVQPQLLVAYGPANTSLSPEQALKDHTLASKGCFCIWDLAAPAQPSEVLVSEGVPTCCKWGTAKHLHMVFAGMAEGGLCAWDLRERASLHPQEQVGSQTVTTRVASYSTERAAELATASPVADIAVMPVAGSTSQGQVCQVVVLMAWGTAAVYMVYDRMAAGLDLASDSDMAARLGSRISMLLTSQVQHLGKEALFHASTRRSAQSTGTAPGPTQARHTYCLAVTSTRPCHFLAGSDQARILRGAAVGLPPAPKEYHIPDSRSVLDASTLSPAVAAAHVTSLHVSPTRPSLFLSGHSDGTVTLHCTSWSQPLASWQQAVKGAVVAVRWSPAREAVFLVLDGLGTLHCFDLAVDRHRPVHRAHCVQQPGSDQRAVRPVGLEVCLGDAGLRQAGAGAAGQLPYAVTYSDGSVQCHLFVEGLAAGGGPEDGKVLDELLGKWA